MDSVIGKMRVSKEQINCLGKINGSERGKRMRKVKEKICQFIKNEDRILVILKDSENQVEIVL